MVRPMPICLRLLRHWRRLALSLALASAGSSSAAKMAMMAMTTSNSIKVKAARRTAVWFGIFLIWLLGRIRVIGVGAVPPWDHGDMAVAETDIGLTG